MASQSRSQRTARRRTSFDQMASRFSGMGAQLSRLACVVYFSYWQSALTPIYFVKCAAFR
eukprot:3716471-Pleurochrysis_carterae.AAC.1